MSLFEVAELVFLAAIVGLMFYFAFLKMADAGQDGPGATFGPGWVGMILFGGVTGILLFLVAYGLWGFFSRP